jgi:CBS domain containing-hemolysin-like protein
VGSALFSAFETALFSFHNHELERLRRQKSRYADALTRLLSNPRRLLGVLVFGYVALNVPLVMICLYLSHIGLIPVLPFWGGELLIFGLVVFVCDLFPKVAALANPYRLIRPAVRILEPLLTMLDAPLKALQGVADRFAEMLLPLSPGTASALPESQMETLIELGAEDGALHPVEAALIQEIIQLGSKTVRDCMTPRVDALCIPDDLTPEELAARLRKARYRRVPVYADTPDNILGILEVRACLESNGVHYTELLTPPSFVPETMKAVDLLRSFLRRPQALAIVVDEHGGTEGVITRADLLEEVLAEALPGSDRELYIEGLGDGRFVVSGSARLEDLCEALEVGYQREGIDTVGGLIFTLCGIVPKLGTVLEIGPFRFTVRRTSRKRVEELLAERLGNHAPERPGEGGAA